MRRSVPVAARSASSRRAVDDPPAVGVPRAGRARGRTAGAGRPASSGRGGARSRDSGAPASTSAAETASVRGRGVRMGERRGVHDDAGHQRRRERAVAGVERHVEARREQRDHLARRGRGRVDPVAPGRRPSFEAWWSTSTRGSRVEQLRDGGRGPRRAGRASRSRRRRAGRSRRPARDRSEPVHARRGSRRAAAPGRCEMSVARPPWCSTIVATPSAAPSVSASGFSWPTTRTCRARRDGARRPRPGPPSQPRAGRSTLIRAAASGPPVRPCAVRAVRRAAPARRRGGGAPAAADPAARAGSLSASPSWRQPRRPGVGSDLAVGRPSSPARSPASSSARSWSTRVPRWAVSSSADVELRDPAEPEPRRRARGARTASRARAPRSSRRARRAGR